MSEGREGRRFFVSFIKKRKEGASCFGSFLKRTFRGVVKTTGQTHTKYLYMEAFSVYR